MSIGPLRNIPGLEYVRHEQVSDSIVDVTVRGECREVGGLNGLEEYQWTSGEVTTQALFRYDYRISDSDAYRRYRLRGPGIQAGITGIIGGVFGLGLGWIAQPALSRVPRISGGIQLSLIAVAGGVGFFLFGGGYLALMKRNVEEEIRAGEVSMSEVRWIEKKVIDENPPAGGSHCSPPSHSHSRN